MASKLVGRTRVSLHKWVRGFSHQQKVTRPLHQLCLAVVKSKVSVMGNGSYPVHPPAVDALLRTANSAGPFAARAQTSESFLGPLGSRFAFLNAADREQDASSSLLPRSRCFPLPARLWHGAA